MLQIYAIPAFLCVFFKLPTFSQGMYEAAFVPVYPNLFANEYITSAADKIPSMCALISTDNPNRPSFSLHLKLFYLCDSFLETAALEVRPLINELLG